MKKLIYKGSISGGMCAKVYLDFEEGGSSVIFPSGDEPYIIISIGSAYDDWYEVYDGALHELMEMHMMTMELSYQRLYRAGCDTGDVWFHFNHGEYSEAISRTAQSMLCFIDKAEKAFDAQKKVKPKKKRKKAIPKPEPKKPEENIPDPLNS